jgi:hypothetical protein
MRAFTIVCLVLGASASASAATSGVVYGFINATDSRNLPYGDWNFDNVQKRHNIAAKFRQADNTNSIVPLKNAAVEISVCSAPTSCVTQNVYTSSSGYFSWNWSSAVDRNIVTVIVHAERKKVDSAGVGPYSISIKPSLGVQPVVLKSYTSQALVNAWNGNFSINFTLAPSEASNAYLTAEEVVTIVQNDTISGAAAPDNAASMAAYAHRSFSWLDLVVNDTTISPDKGGIAPTNGHILLNPGAGSNNTAAHEMGHTIMWRMHDDLVAPINPTSDYMCDGTTGWDPDSLECERAAFMEGFADFIFAVYTWRRLANDAYQHYYWLAASDAKCPPHDPANPNNNHRMAQCNTRGLWAVYRANSLGKILKAVDSYFPACVAFNDNHCENERYYGPLLLQDRDAQNWKDFWYNWELANGTSLNSITNTVGLQWSEL